MQQLVQFQDCLQKNQTTVPEISKTASFLQSGLNLTLELYGDWQPAIHAAQPRLDARMYEIARSCVTGAITKPAYNTHMRCAYQGKQWTGF